MGWKVLFLDRLDPAPGIRHSRRVQRTVEVMQQMGLEGAYSLDVGPDGPPVGVSRADVRKRVRDADFLLNIMGYLGDPELLGTSRRNVFLDIDPGFAQMWYALGLCDPFAGHDRFVTVGTRVGQTGCVIPTCGHGWITTLPPVDLTRWRVGGGPGERYSSIVTWRGPFDAVQFEGVRYGLRAHEFRRFAGLPHAVGAPLELALDIAAADERDAVRLRAGGWALVDPRKVAGDPISYRRYVEGSRGEFGVAKGMYVNSRSGWFSDRTACYLAAGRPAIVQDTALHAELSAGEGLVTFVGPDDAVDAVREVESDWDRHARAARELAEAHLDAHRVLGRLAAEVAA
jgi:hypothetical protein